MSKKLNRRSFLRRVGGGGVIGGAMISIVGGGGASASDRDPTDPSRPTRYRDQDGLDTTGVTDHDANDAAGNGGNPRGLNTNSAPTTRGLRITDQDPTDGGGRGRGAGNGHTDRDPTDATGRGNSGLTDRDPTDRVGHGRG